LIPRPGTVEKDRCRFLRFGIALCRQRSRFLPCGYGFRPKRSPHDALHVVIDEAWRGRVYVSTVDQCRHQTVQRWRQDQRRAAEAEFDGRIPPYQV
jgi:hypothetical protein